MVASIYCPLPTDPFSIRLVGLQPSEDPSAPIRCKLFTYALTDNRSGEHLYECLSYVWGSAEDPMSISIDNTVLGQNFVQTSNYSSDAPVKFDATQNLHAALVRLRDPCFERILWVDALCINQYDEKEKAQQVSAMARIYGLAQRVVVWLGEEADESALAFEELRNLALNHQRMGSASLEPISTEMEDHELSHDINNACGDDQERTSTHTEQAVHALLNRVYFRRMWILQEVTAARNILFKCGDSELQTTTFLAGVNALTHLDDWMLRSRIRAFILLIESSAYRESLKGQAHLNIAPLAELVDMFHTQDATDSRDKIYALWGLCSDSKLVKRLQPDYTRHWRDLLEQLGRVVFNQRGTFSASHHRQTMFLRIGGYDLGKINEVSTDGIWDKTQVIRINSMRASRYLDDVGSWSMRCKLQASSAEIQKNDVVLFLPHAKRLVVARPEKYNCRIVMIANSRLVQAYRTPTEQRSSGWVSWQPWLNNIAKAAKESPLPLLWNWESTGENEPQEALVLMNDWITNPSSCTNALLEARALSDMASLFMDWGEYDQASRLLISLVNIYTSVYGAKADATGQTLARLTLAQVKSSRYQKAAHLLSRISDSRSIVEDCCLHVSLYATRATPQGKQYAPHHVLLDIASKLMSEGVSKDMLLYAVGLLDESDASELHGNYLQFLLDMAEKDLYISPTDLLTAAIKPITGAHFIQLAKRTESPIDNLPDILRALMDRKIQGSFVREFIVEIADRVVVTSEAIDVAVLWDEDALLALLVAARSPQVVTPNAFRIAVASRGRSIIPRLELLVQHANSNCEISEDTLIRLAEKGNEDIYIALVEHAGPTITITEPVLMAAINTTNEFLSGGILPFLRFRPDVHITDDMLEEAEKCQHEEVRAWTCCLLLDLRDSTKPIRQEDIEAIPAEKPAGYASMINLTRYRRAEFEITKDMILNAVCTTKKEPFQTSTFDLYGKVASESYRTIDKFVSWLIKHAPEEVIESLSQSAVIAHIAASDGYPRVLRTLHSRLKRPIPDFESLSLIAQICQMTQQLIPPIGDKGIPSISHLIKELAETEHTCISNDIKFAMFVHALQNLPGGGLNVTKSLLNHGIIEPNTVNSRGETPLHLVALPVCEFQSLSTVVRYLMGHGGEASIDAPDARGRTPRQMVDQNHEREFDPERDDTYRWYWVREVFDNPLGYI